MSVGFQFFILSLASERLWLREQAFLKTVLTWDLCLPVWNFWSTHLAAGQPGRK